MDIPLETLQFWTCKPYLPWPCQSSVLVPESQGNLNCWTLLQGGCVFARQGDSGLPSHSNSCKTFAPVEYEGKIFAWRAFRHCTSRPKENASSQLAIMWQTFTQIFLRKGRTMSLGVQCVQNTSCPTAQMLPVKPRAPSYKKGNCPARQRSNVSKGSC